jgi:tetraspanin-11
MMLLGGILGSVFKEKVASTMEQEMITSLKFYGSRRDVTLAWDETQTRLRCCGVNNYNDWRTKVPDSCCQETYGGQRKPCMESPAGNVYDRGCLNISYQFMRHNASIIFGAGIFVAILMIVAMVLSCAYFKMIE